MGDVRLSPHGPGDARDPAKILLAQDVIYVGGGSMRNLLAIWRVHGLDRLLRDAWERGVVLAGLSAGAMCWFDGGVTTSSGAPEPTPAVPPVAPAAMPPAPTPATATRPLRCSRARPAAFGRNRDRSRASPPSRTILPPHAQSAPPRAAWSWGRCSARSTGPCGAATGCCQCCAAGTGRRRAGTRARLRSNGDSSSRPRVRTCRSS